MFDGDAGQLLPEASRRPVSCGKAPCVSLCSCSASSCTTSDKGMDVQFDGTLLTGGQELMGTLVLGSTRVTARFTRE